MPRTNSAGYGHFDSIGYSRWDSYKGFFKCVHRMSDELIANRINQPVKVQVFRIKAIKMTLRKVKPGAGTKAPHIPHHCGTNYSGDNAAISKQCFLHSMQRRFT